MLKRQRHNLKGIAREPQSSQLVVKDAKGTEFVALDIAIQEKISQLSRIEVAVLTKDSDPTAWLGETVSCQIFDQISTSREAIRTHSGVVTQVETLFSAEEGRFNCFLLTLEPWFALLQYSKNYRVFQEKTTKQIVGEIFDELGFKEKYKINSMPTAKREYCLQFNESDYDFVCRLLAEEGVHYYFGKDADSNLLYLQDAIKPFSEKNKLSFDYSSTRTGDNQNVFTWAPAYQYHAAKLELAGYDPQQTKLVKSAAKTSLYPVSGNTKLTDYVYPHPSVTGKYDDLAKALLTTRRAQLDSNYLLIKGEGLSHDMATGHYLTLASHTDESQLGDYLVLESNYQYAVDNDGALSHSMDFVCTANDHAYYPEFIEKPQVQGMYSAVVAGSKDGECTCDAQGRIKIKFHWDDNKGDKTSCWVRVAQPMAGNGYGIQFIPRAGQEVLVTFLEADIDRPVVTASLYNSKHKPPYAEAETTQSGIKTQLKGQSNELRFDDKKDSEQLYLHAAKDYLVEVENDAKEQITGNSEHLVDKDITTTTKKNFSLTATEKITEKGKQITLEGEDSITLKVGSSELKMTASKIELKSSEISLKGDSKVTLDGMQVVVKGSTKVDISSSASVAVKAGTDLKASGLNAELSGSIAAKVKGSATAEISGGGMTTVKGGVVMIN